MRLTVRHRVPIVAVVLTAIVAFPLGAIASHQFTDVPNSNTFHDDIDAIRDAGVTTGCALNLYCPKDFVTREQMAAFLNRLGALGPGKTPVVNADKVDGVDEVLAADEVVMSTSPEWLPNAGSPVTFTYYAGGTQVFSGSAGIRSVHEGLPSPEIIGGRAYGIASVEICWLGSPGVDLLNAFVIRARATDTSVVIQDDTDRDLTADGCATMVPPGVDEAEGPATILLDLNFDSATDVELGNVTVTWSPVPTP